MKVLVVHNFYNNPGGEDSVVSSEIALLKQYKHDVYFYQRNNQEIQGFSVSQKIKHFANLSYSQSSYNDLQKIIVSFKPDIAHFHNLFYLITPSVYFACRDAKVPIVQTLHNFRPICANGLFFRKNKPCRQCSYKSQVSGFYHRCFQSSFIKSLVLTRSLKRLFQDKVWEQKVDSSIALSSFSKDIFIEEGFPEEKIFIKPNFDYQLHVAKMPKEDYFLYVGRLSQEKGIWPLVQVFEKGKTKKLKIIGDGPLREAIKKYIEQKKLTNIELLGFLPKEDCQTHILKAGFVIVPSLCYENCPRIVIEAYSLGVPVLGSDTGSLKEMIIDGRTGRIFNPYSIDDMTEKIIKYNDDAQSRAQLGRNALSLYEEKYTPQINYKLLMNIYEKTIKGLSPK